MIKTIEVDRWSEPDAQRRVKHIGMIKAKDAFDQLEKHLKEHGLLPDEYFLFSEESFRDGMEDLPNYDQAVCQVNFGASEGIYLDIALEIPGEKGRFKSFATGKTLSEHADAYRHMSRIAGECSLLLNGRGMDVKEQRDCHKQDGIFAAEFAQSIKPFGFKLTPGTKRQEYTLTHGGLPVGTFDADNEELMIKTSTLGQVLTEQLRIAYRTTYEYTAAYATAPPLCAEGVSDYHELCRINGIVLAAKHRGAAGYQFVTWECDTYGTGVNAGHYFEGDYRAAKQDFTVRAELIPPAVIFSDAELTLIGAALAAQEQSTQSYNEATALQALAQRIGDTLQTKSMAAADAALPHAPAAPSMY